MSKLFKAIQDAIQDAKMPNAWENAEKHTAAHGKHTVVCNNHFNIAMDKKFQGFDTCIISKLTESMKNIIPARI